MKKLKEMAKENWKGTVAGVVITVAVVMFGLPADMLFSGSEMVLADEDLKAKICGPEEPVKKEEK